MKKKAINIRRRFIRSENEMPKILILAELFIAVLCMSYILKISGLALDIIEAERPSVKSVAILEMDVIFFGMTLFAALGVYSRKPESWRKVVRSCVIFTISAIISRVSSSGGHVHDFDFNPWATFIALALLLIIMITSSKVKKFYTPPMMPVPRTKEWIRYAFIGKLVDSKYIIGFSNTKKRSSPGIVPDSEDPEDVGPIFNNMV